MVLRKTGYVLLAVLAVALVGALVYAQGGGGGMGPGGGGMGPGMAPGGGMGRMLDQMSLTDAQKQAVRKVIAEKQTGRQDLRTELERLQAVAERKEATEADLKKAVAEYLAARDKVAKKNADLDRNLMKSLPVKAQAQLLVAGIVDNGGVRAGGRRAGAGGGAGGAGGAGGGGRMRGTPE